MMRTTILTIVTGVVMSSSAPAFAQGGTFGLKLGTVGARVTAHGPGGFDANADLGAALGGFAGIELTRTVRVQPEVLFTLRRFKSSDLPENLQVRSRVIEMPVLIQKRFRAVGGAQPMLFGGPQVGIVAKVSQQFGDVQSDVTADLHRVDIGWTAGGGYEIPAGRGMAVLEARVTAGIRDLSRSGETSMKSRGFLILFGYRFQ